MKPLFLLQVDLRWLSQGPIVVQTAALCNIAAPGETQRAGRPRKRASTLHKKLKCCLFLRMRFSNWSINEEALLGQ